MRAASKRRWARTGARLMPTICLALDAHSDKGTAALVSPPLPLSTFLGKREASLLRSPQSARPCNFLTPEGS